MKKKLLHLVLLLSSASLLMFSCKKESNNHPPVAHAGQDLTIVLPDSTVTLNGNASTDPDNNINTYEWSKTSGSSSCNIANINAAETQVSLLVPGEYQFELKVTDAGGLISKDAMRVVLQPNIAVFCEPGRPVITAKLESLGFLSAGRVGLVSAAAGSKILFAGGMTAGAYSSRVDIYDTVSKTWSTAELTKPERQGMVAASVGNKIFFAGGNDNDMGGSTSRVDIFDVSTNAWDVAELSQSRGFLAAATLGDKVFFAGGTSWEGDGTGRSTWVTSSQVDIYNNSTNTWATATLSENRSDLSATSLDNKIYFSGGFAGPFVNNVSARIDVFDATKNSWSTSRMDQAKALHASIGIGNKIFFAAGIFNYANSTFYPSNTVEIRDINTGVSSHVCMIPKIMLSAVVKDNDIVFFPGNIDHGEYSGSSFEIYNTINDSWSTGYISQEIYDATIISVNNTIYIAGGRNQPFGPYSAEVWKLVF